MGSTHYHFVCLAYTHKHPNPSERERERAIEARGSTDRIGTTTRVFFCQEIAIEQKLAMRARLPREKIVR